VGARRFRFSSPAARAVLLTPVTAKTRSAGSAKQPEIKALFASDSNRKRFDLPAASIFLKRHGQYSWEGRMWTGHLLCRLRRAVSAHAIVHDKLTFTFSPLSTRQPARAHSPIAPWPRIEPIA
jgi:hypothetical protein